MEKIELNVSEIEIKQQPAYESDMRVLSENEILSVAGGPEVDVESGAG
ncbi:hypothetical protein [Undibacterium pigrum]|uniref:Uncharacterized protein n=1 Tax=Undibacterium pigrum TaxID=401470 RepID=A0A318JB51_9BURK|nr:hypothetical protein [Undibacterium pigrum]PXX45328.1 hypothetical protein DFR42_102556 [Undibacterium pigrum]